jgi:uncharacterized protein (DUF924 family)
MLHNDQVVTTVSALAPSRGILSAEPSMNSTDREAERLARRAMARSFGEEISPVTSSSFFFPGLREKAKPPVAQQQSAGGFAVCEWALRRRFLLSSPGRRPHGAILI